MKDLILCYGRKYEVNSFNVFETYKQKKAIIKKKIIIMTYIRIV